MRSPRSQHWCTRERWGAVWSGVTRWAESREIAEQLVGQEADSVVALKATQPDLLEAVMDCFTQAEAEADHEVRHQVAETINTGHGRLDLPRHTVLREPAYLAWLQQAQHWPGLQALGRVEAERGLGEEGTREVRYSLLSRERRATAKALAVRSHWGSAHAFQWVFAVIIGRDHPRMRAGHAAETMAVLRAPVRHLLEREQSQPGRSIKGKRPKQAGITTTCSKSSPAFRCVGPAQIGRVFQKSEQ